MEPTMQEAVQAVDRLNRLFEEFKRTNDVRLDELKTKGVSDPLLTEKLDKLNAAIDAQSKVNDDFIAMKTVVDRLAAAGIQTSADKAIEEKTVARFNLDLREIAIATGRDPVKVTADQVKRYNEIFEKFLRKGERALTELERRELTVGTDSQGGYLVSPDMSGRVVTKIFETSPMRQYAAVQAISTDTLEGAVDLDEASAGWVSELGSRSESNTPAVPAPWKIPTHEAYSEPHISQKLVEDARVDVVAWLAGKVADKFARLFNAAFVTGSGSGKPRGFASYTTAATADGSRSWGVFEHEATGAASALHTDPATVENLLDMIHATKDHFLPNAAWYCNRLTLGAIRKKTDASSAGKYVFIPSFQAGLPDTIFGFPVRKLQDMADIGTDTLPLAFGDMQAAYQIVDRLGMSTLVDPYTAKPYVKYYTRARVGGDVLNFEALKFLKVATS